MKNVFKLLAIAIAVVGFSFTSCDNGNKPEPNQTPVASDYTIGNLNQTAGSVTAVTITAKSGKSTGTVLNVKYNGNSAIPQTAGTYAVTFDVATATGWNEAVGLYAGNLVVTDSGSTNSGTAPTIITATLPDGTVGIPYSQTLTAIGDTPITWSLESGALPTGLTFATSGLISGTPTTAGYPGFTVKATNATGNDTKQLSIIIASGGDNNGNNVTNQTPVTSDYTVDNLNQTAGSVTAVTITAKSGKSTGTVLNVKYNGDTVIPQTAGTYAVTFDVAAVTGWNEAIGLSAGNLVLTNSSTDSSGDGGDRDITVTFNSVTANGSSSQTTTQLTLTFNQAIIGLSASDITLSGVFDVSKGTLSGSGSVYTLNINGFTVGGTLSVAVAKSGYAINGSTQSTTIYYYSDIAVTFNSVTNNGNTTTTTTYLTLTFSQAITGLSASDITLSGVSGVIKGSFSGSGPSYTLYISGFTAGGTLSVAVAKSGYAISSSPKSTTIYYMGKLTISGCPYSTSSNTANVHAVSTNPLSVSSYLSSASSAAGAGTITSQLVTWTGTKVPNGTFTIVVDILQNGELKYFKATGVSLNYGSGTVSWSSFSQFN